MLSSDHPLRSRLVPRAGVVLASITALVLGGTPAAWAATDIGIGIAVRSGSGDFDDDDGPGNDSSADNDIIRTNDNVIYVPEITANGDADAGDVPPENVVITIELPRGQEVGVLPAYCGEGSSITPPVLPALPAPLTSSSWTSLERQTIVCAVGDVDLGSTTRFPIAAKVRPEVPNGTQLDGARVTVAYGAEGSRIENGPTDTRRLTVSARPQADLSKTGAFQPAGDEQKNSGGAVAFRNVDCVDPQRSGQKCVRLSYPVVVSIPRGGLGAEPLQTPMTFTDTVDPAEFFPEVDPAVWGDPDNVDKYAPTLVGCSASSLGRDNPLATRAGAPRPEQAVSDSGSIDCAQPGGPGTPISVTIADADTRGVHCPDSGADGGSLPADRCYIVSSRMEIEFPRTAIEEIGVDDGAGTQRLLTRNRYRDFEPTGLSGLPNDESAFGPVAEFDDSRWYGAYRRYDGGYNVGDKDFTAIADSDDAVPPADYEGTGSFWGPYGSAVKGDGNGIVGPSTTVLSTNYGSVNSFSEDPKSVSLLQCDMWDPDQFTLAPGDHPVSGVGAALSPSDGKAVWATSYYDGSGYRANDHQYEDGAKRAPVKVEVQYAAGGFGSGDASRCGDGDSDGGWHDSPEQVPGGIEAVNKVRILTVWDNVRVGDAVPGDDDPSNDIRDNGLRRAYYHIALRTADDLQAGDRLGNWQSRKYSLFNRDMATLANEVLDPREQWQLSNYDPQTHAGSSTGDRLTYGATYVRMRKEVRIGDAPYSGTLIPGVAPGTTVDYRIPFSVNSATDSAIVDAVIEDCIPNGLALMSSEPPATSISDGAPEGAGLACPAGSTYVTWDMGQVPANRPLEPIHYQVTVLDTAASGLLTNTAPISSDKDDSSESLRRDSAAINVASPSGVKIAKRANRPTIEVNPSVGTDDPRTLDWTVDFKNLSADGGSPLRDIDIIDILPYDGGPGSDFDGTARFDSATSSTPGVTFLYTKADPSTISLDARDASNDRTDGSTAWCDSPGGGQVVAGAPNADGCPAEAGEVTGLRVLRSGALDQGDGVSFGVRMVAYDNQNGDTYRNRVSGRVTGLNGLVGPKSATIRALGSTIGDRVWLDLDGDGVQDPDEPGVPDFPVSVVVTDDRGNTYQREVTTDEDGYYTVPGMPGGDFEVTFDPTRLADRGARFTTVDAGDDDEADSDAAEDGRAGVRQLTAGSDDLTVDAGITGSLQVGDRVWVDTDADGIQDPEEKGLEGVEVTLTGRNGLGVEFELTTTTDADGAYLFDRLLPPQDGTSYTVAFGVPDGYTVTRRDTSDGGGDDTNDSDGDAEGIVRGVLENATESDTTVDLGLVKPASVGDRVWDDRDGNGYQDADEPGIGGVGVTLTGENLRGEPVNRRVVTDDDGGYLFSDVEPGVYVVTFEDVDGYVRTAADVISVGDDKDSDADASGRSAEFVLDASGTDNLTIDAGYTRVGAIGDRVWSDLDGDGIQDPDEPGVPGVTVTLTGTDALGARVTRTAVTGPDGDYLFSDVLSGDYSLVFGRTDGSVFTLADAGEADDADSDANADGVVPSFRYDSAAGPNLTIDAGVVALGSLGDRVWNDLDHDGLQDEGEPGIADVEVTLTGTDGRGEPVTLTTTTDDEGRYLFTQLRPGDYTVTFAVPEGMEVSPRRAGEDAAIDSDIDENGSTGSFAYDPADGGDRTVDAGFYGEGSIGDRVFYDTDRNGRQDDGETGVAGVTVSLLDESGAVIRTVATGDDGGYSFDGVGYGRYRVRFDRPSGTAFTSVDQDGVDDAEDSDAAADGLTGAFLYDPAGGADTSVDAGLVRTASIGDTVFEDGDNDGVQDPDEVGIRNVSVTLIGADGADISTVFTDANGNYSFDDLPSGTYRIRIDTPGGYAFSPQNAGDDRGADSDVDQATGVTGPIEFDAGLGNRDDIDAGLVPVGEIGDRVWSDIDADGIQDADEPGRSGIPVRLYDAGGRLVAQTETDPQGRYSFKNVPAGDYRVEIDVPDDAVVSPPKSGGDPTLDSDSDPAGSSPVFGFAPTSPGDPQSPGVLSDLTIDFGLVPAAGIGDRVWVDADGNGVQDEGENGKSGVTVTLVDADGRTRTTTTGEDGQYFFPDLVAGTYRIRFTAPEGFTFTDIGVGTDDAVDSNADPDGRTGEIRFDPARGPNVSIDAGLVPVVPVTSIGDTVFVDDDADGIQDDGEQGLAGVTVELLDAAGTVIATEITDGDGRYLFTDVPAGTYRVRFVNPDVQRYTFTDQGAGTDPTLDSDADPATGLTAEFDVDPASGPVEDIDAGLRLVPPTPSPTPSPSPSPSPTPSPSTVTTVVTLPPTTVTSKMPVTVTESVTLTSTLTNSSVLVTTVPTTVVSSVWTTIPTTLTSTLVETTTHQTTAHHPTTVTSTQFDDGGQGSLGGVGSGQFGTGSLVVGSLGLGVLAIGGIIWGLQHGLIALPPFVVDALAAFGVMPPRATPTPPAPQKAPGPEIDNGRG